MIPQPPKRKKIQFNDPDYYQQKKDFNVQIRKIIIGFSNIIPRSKNRDSLLKFLNCVHPGKNPDSTRLPYIGRGKNATSENKLACIFALISNVVQRYWDFVNPEDGVEYELSGYYSEQINQEIKQLQEILSNGLGEYQIDGDLAKGFYLEKK